jgi:hypothetical protein
VVVIYSRRFSKPPLSKTVLTDEISVRQDAVPSTISAQSPCALAPGVYRYWPEHAELEKIKEGDQRLVATALSLGQDLAGNACLAFSMIGDLENAARSYGDRGDRYVHSRRALLVNECILLPRRLACEQQASERFLMGK